VTTSIAQQDDARLGGPLSILTLQRRDHERLDRLMDRARQTLVAGGVEHEVTLRAIARLVFTHAFAEEAVLFPAARKVLPEGDPLSLHIEEEHQEVNELVTRLDRSSLDDPEHAELMERAFAALDEDVRSEEDELLPRLQQELSVRQLQLLGLQWGLLRLTSPTRPHAVVSRRPPGQVLSALPLTFLDRARDRLQQLGEALGGRGAGVLRTVDDALAGASGAVERMPVIRTGQRPETARGTAPDRDRSDDAAPVSRQDETRTERPV
jgi:hemerythrin superfamily protein